MKKKVYCLLAFCLIVASSCKKEHKNGPNNSNALHKVILNVGFSKQITNFQANPLTTNAMGKTDAVTNDTALTNHITTLVYVIYNASTGAMVQALAQNTASGSNSFGNFTANLATGNYIVVIAGGGDLLEIANPTGVVAAYGYSVTQSGNINTDILQYATDPNVNLPYPNSSKYPGNFVQDTFFKKINLSVSDSDESENVALDRITSKLELVVQDALPNGIYSISLTSTLGTASQLSLSTVTPLTFGGLNASFGLAYSQAGMINYTCSSIFLSASLSTFNVDITASSKTQTLVYKAISGVSCQPNTITVLSGKLFNNNTTSNTGLAVTVDTAWSSSTIVKTFP